MKTELRLAIALGALVALCAGQYAYGQYPAMSGGYPSYPAMAGQADLIRPAAYRVSVVGEGLKDEGAKDDCDKGGGKGDCEGPTVRVFGEYLYLRVRDNEVAYGVEADSNAPMPIPAIQRSRVGVLDQDYSSGFRFGVGVFLDECSEIAASYTWFETATSDSLTTVNPLRAIDPMTVHPATRAAFTPTVQAGGRHDIDMDLIDIDYRRYWVQDCSRSMAYVVGVRWGNLEQNFAARYTDDLASDVDNARVLTDVDFTGAGIHLGLEAEQYASRLPVLVYAKGFASILAGEFDATYFQQMPNSPGVPDVNTSWEAGRLVPTLDLEVGGGLCTHGGALRATVGYVFSAWDNLVKTEDWIHAVQTNDFRDMNDSMTLDGLVFRVEGRF
jgi:hypothetical protein